MLRSHMKRHTLIMLGLASVALFAACTTTDREGERVENRPPTVWLASAPPEGTTEKYTIQLFWGGWDPDGEIAYYEYAITDNGDGPFLPSDTAGDENWHPVYGNDSLFTFSADELTNPNANNMVSEFTRSHTFFIRAVDEQGLRSVEPAYRSFTARTLSPRVDISVPQRNQLNPAAVPPITTFRWTATDYIDDLLTSQAPDSVQYALVDTRGFNENWAKTIDYLRKDPAVLTEFGRTEEQSDAEWGDWVYYGLPQDSGKFWTTEPLEYGPYVFAIRAKDEAGAVTPVLDEIYNVRRVRVSNRSTGPLFTVTNEYMGSITTSSPTTPLVILDLPAGVPIRFCWNASADEYGGIVSGYRYGWDIGDLEDPEQWETDFTPFVTENACSPSRTFFFGTHTFTCEVVDNSGYNSRVEVKVNIVQFTLQKNLLVLDDFEADKDLFQAGWTNQVGRGVLPNDAEHDQFWEFVLENVGGFDPATDVLEVRGDSKLPLTRVANYKSIIWSVYSHVDQIQQLPLLYNFIQYRQKNPTAGASSGGKREPNLLALFMAAGGHVLITGQHPMSNVKSRALGGAVRYPLIYLYELEGEQEREPDIENTLGDQSFTYKEMCLDAIDYAVSSFSRRRTSDMYCSVVGIRNVSSNALRDNSMRWGIPIDPNFVRIDLRPETASPGKAHAPDVKGLNVEVYNPQYFMDLCAFTPRQPRGCFQPIYGLGCLDPNEPVYGAPVAFWTSAFADRVAEVPGAVGARSAVFGFPPVYFNPTEVKVGIEYILFDEWQLPRVN